VLEEALEIAIEIGDQSNVAWTRVFLGSVISIHGDHQEGTSLLEEGLEEYQALDSAGKYGLGFALALFGDGAFYQGDYQRAQEIYENSVEILNKVQDLNLLAYSLRRLSHTARYLGDLETAANKCEESLALNVNLGHKSAIVGCISCFACILLDRGDELLAAQLFAAVETQLEMIGVWLIPSDSFEFERNVALARERLGEEAFTAAWAEGRTMTTEQTMEVATHDAARKG
jgi:tetratricopeptide (TPR) repeat protein